jgi:N-acetylmuramoyl-L-alanine amidase
MSKQLLATATLLFFFIVVLAEKHPPVKPHKKQTIPKTIKTVIIDPGHGGRDPGASGTNSTEAAVALEVSLQLGAAIEKEFPGTKIIYTRTTDILPGNLNNKDAALRLRAEIANKAKGDLFISIHCNSAGRRAGGWYDRRVVGHRSHVVTIKKGRRKIKKTISEPIFENFWVENKVKGTETYIWSAGKTGDKEEALNQEEYGEDAQIDSASTLDLESSEAKLRAQLYTKYYFKNSATLASNIEQSFRAAGRVDRGGVKQRNNKGIWVLQATGMPSVLVEIGFITNKEEEEYLNSEKGQSEVVSNILEGFRQYKHQLENPTKTNSATSINDGQKN